MSVQDLLDRYCCFARTRHRSKNRDLNLIYETLLCFAFLILCKAHFVALKIFTQGILSSETITKKLPTWYYLRACQQYPCKKSLPIYSLIPEISIVVIHSVVLIVDIFLQVRKGGRRYDCSHNHKITALCYHSVYISLYYSQRHSYVFNGLLKPTCIITIPMCFQTDWKEISWEVLGWSWRDIDS